jgi:hypothetical protein
MPEDSVYQSKNAKQAGKDNKSQNDHSPQENDRSLGALPDQKHEKFRVHGVWSEGKGSIYSAIGLKSRSRRKGISLF